MCTLQTFVYENVYVCMSIERVGRWQLKMQFKKGILIILYTPLHYFARLLTHKYEENTYTRSHVFCIDCDSPYGN